MEWRAEQESPDTPSETKASAFVGRDVELAAIRNALDCPPALVMVEGEPGIGKTRLINEALAARDRGTTLLTACPPLTEPFPLGPVVDGIRGFGDIVSEVELSPLCGALRPLFPEWASWLPPALDPAEDPAETRHRLFRALMEVVERLNVEVLVVEDAHWADSATLEWLLTLTSAPGHDISIVVTFRPTDVPAASALWRLTSRVPAGGSRLRVGLEPLNVEQTRRLVGSMFGDEEVSEGFAVFLRERSDGIPLAIEESVLLLQARRDIFRHEGRWTRRLLDELEVPPTVRDSVLERVARLPAEAQRVLEAVAVIAEPANDSQIAAVADLNRSQLESGVAAGLSAGLLRESDPGRFGFRHVLASQAVDEAIPAIQRRRLHGRAVSTLRILVPEPVVRLARHCREAGDTESWCTYAEASADLAWKSGDDRMAVLTLLDMLTTVTHEADRAARLACKLGERALNGTAAFGISGSRIEHALRAVINRPDLPASDRGEIRLWLGRVLHNVTKVRLAIDEFEAAIPDLGHRLDLLCRAMVMLAMPQTPAWPAQRHLDWLNAATDLSDQIRSPLDRQWFAAMRASALILLGEEAGWDAAGELPDSGSTRGERRVAAVGHLNVGQSAIEWGRYGEARHRLGKAVEIIEVGGLDQMRSNIRVAEAYVDWYTGVWDGLMATATAMGDAEDSEHLLRLEAQQLTGLLELARGDRIKAATRFRTILDEYRRLDAAEPFTTLAPAAMARLYLADGAVLDAIAMTAPMVGMIARKGVWLWGGDILPVYVAALVAGGRSDDAGAVTKQFAGGLAGRHAPAPAAALLVCRAVLAEDTGGEPGHAAELFAKAAAAWAALPRPYDELLAYERQGLNLLSAGERDAGLTVLTDAEQRLHQLGARWDADRMARHLREHGVEVSRAWKRGPRGYGDQLSPRELEVLTRVAQGMTNREVGQALFLSPRTVAAHLSAAMHKLGVSSRTAAAIAATEAGLIEADSHVQATPRPNSDN